MLHYQCKCGKNKSYGSMSPASCFECEDCHTTLEHYSSLHERAKEHNWSKTEVNTDEGIKTLTICSWCGIRKREWEIKTLKKL